MIDSFTGFIYGMCVMFYSLMVWMFWRRGKDRLSRVIVCLMGVLDIECVKDLLTFECGIGGQTHGWYLMNVTDIIVMPFYVFVLMELVKPGWLTWKKALLHECSFVGLLLLFAVSEKFIWFNVLVIWGAIYGCATYILTFFFISSYHRHLKERFSYQENINLNWLRGILTCFFVILVAWVVSCYMLNVDYDNVYMLCSLAAWMFVCYFLYRHESVIEELNENDTDLQVIGQVGLTNENVSAIAEAVQRLFVEDKLYLDSKLKLSDVARHVGTNRTYLSRYFNQEQGLTFYDYVNKFRIAYAEELLVSTELNLTSVAEKSGFNSLSTFRRVFGSIHDCSPTEYRNRKRR